MRRLAVALVLVTASAVAQASPDVHVLTTAPITATESSGYGWRDDPFNHHTRFHAGRDYRADPGTPVLAAGAGTVVFAGWQSGYGRVVYVDHGGGVITRYAHLRAIETKRGNDVEAGDRIGQVGSSGRATGPHLHFEVRIDGRAVDPIVALAVAAIQRDSETLGDIAALALVGPEPERPAVVAQSGKSRARDKQTRPERPGRAPRPQVLW